jgi:nucleoside-diphosphate-sugar epimerase
LKKLLIIGGSGFVGSSIVDNAINKKLIKKKINQIFVLSRSNKSKQKKYEHIKITYINNNILNVKKIPQIDYIIYCLKNTDIKVSNNYFNKFLKLLKTLKNKPNILFTSSGAVYGKNTIKKKVSEKKKIDIKAINNFEGYKKKYAKEKLFIEKKFQDLATKNYNVSIARCFTFIGKNIVRYNYAISDLINAANNENNITLNSQIDVFRSYMHSDDLSNWLITILKNSNTKCPIYNVGSDRVINLKNLTKKIGIMSSKKISIKIKKSNKFDYYIPSILKAKKELNLKNSISLKDALSSTINVINE